MLSGSAGSIELGKTVRAGLLGGLVGGVIIWIYEAIVWVGVQHLMPMAGIPRNATGLVFGKDVQEFTGRAGLCRRHRHPLLLCVRLGRGLCVGVAGVRPSRL